MKLLTIITAVQTVLLITLAYLVLNTSRPAVVQAQNPVLATSETRTEAQRPEPVSIINPAGEARTLTENQLRRVIREELSALIAAMPAEQLDGSASQAGAVSAQEYAERLELANQQLEFYIRRGTVSATEMADLQANIARLDPESRQHMLNLLSRAINSRELDGQF